MNLDRAIQIAAMAHAGRVDKQGSPQILHVIRVMLALSPDWEDMTVGVLHDVLEDTRTTAKDLLKEGLSGELLADLAAVTRSDRETYTGYILRCSQRPRSRRVKRADLADNLARLGDLPDAEQFRLGPRYREARDLLAALDRIRPEDDRANESSPEDEKGHPYADWLETLPAAELTGSGPADTFRAFEAGRAAGRARVRAAWEKRLRLLVAEFRDRAEVLKIDGRYCEGIRQAAIDLEEVIDWLAKKEGSDVQ